ncbi:unnamed protein product, partial [Penicillium discolor]
KESRALEFLDGRLPVAVPSVVALGAPGRGYPFPWSIRRWLDGDTVERAARLDRVRLAVDLGAVLRTVRSLLVDAGWAAGRHSFFRGSHPSVYSDEVHAALQRLDGTLDAELCRSVWLDATSSAWEASPVWFHGDVAVGNLLVSDGRLSAMIDFGTCGVGDPACDLVMAWTYFDGDARAAFRDAVDLDAATWRRARGWALWKALVTLSDGSGPGGDDSRRVLHEACGPRSADDGGGRHERREHLVADGAEQEAGDRPPSVRADHGEAGSGGGAVDDLGRISAFDSGLDLEIRIGRAQSTESDGEGLLGQLLHGGE